MRVTERGQVTIPRGLRERYRLSPDAEIEFVPMEEGLQLRRKNPDAHPVDRLLGYLRKPGSSDTYIEEIRGR